jgi:hypothetical protein
VADRNAYLCPHCGERPPHGDERIVWLDAHIKSLTHAWWWKLKRGWCSIFGHRYPKDWFHHNNALHSQWWGSRTCKTCHHRIWKRFTVW